MLDSTTGAKPTFLVAKEQCAQPTALAASANPLGSNPPVMSSCPPGAGSAPFMSMLATSGAARREARCRETEDAVSQKR
jgi:hypothetical protein